MQARIADKLLKRLDLLRRTVRRENDLFIGLIKCGEGVEEFVANFDYKAFRYFEIVGLPELIDAIQAYYDNLNMHFEKDEILITTKAGHDMWPGPYGDKNGSRKYLLSSLDQSLKRLKLDYVDIFYHHVRDPETPLEETALALDQAVRQGKALYVGISNYNKADTKKIMKIFEELRTPFIVNQPSYSMLNRWIEDDGLRDFAYDKGIGLAVFSPLYQGFLTDRYLNGVPEDSRVGKGNTWIGKELNEEMLKKLNALNEIARNRGQKLSQLALSWVLREGKVTTVLIGASRPEQIVENVEAIHKTEFTSEELEAIENILKG